MEQLKGDGLFHVDLYPDRNAAGLCDEEFPHTGGKTAESFNYYLLCFAAVYRCLCLDTAFGQKWSGYEIVEQPFG